MFRFSPKMTELLYHREMTRWTINRQARDGNYFNRLWPFAAIAQNLRRLAKLVTGPPPLVGQHLATTPGC